MQHPGLDSCIVTEKIVKLSCTVKSLYFTMAEPKRCYLVPGYSYVNNFAGSLVENVSRLFYYSLPFYIDILLQFTRFIRIYLGSLYR